MSTRIKQSHRYEDETFPTPVAMLQWMNAQTAKLKNSWELVGIYTGTRDDGKEFWCGLEFAPIKDI